MVTTKRRSPVKKAEEENPVTVVAREGLPEEPAEPAEPSLNELIAAAVEQDRVLADQQEALKLATESKHNAQTEAQSAWDAIYDRLMALRETHATSAAFAKSKLNRLLKRADR